MIESKYCYRIRTKDRFILYSSFSGAVLGFKTGDEDNVVSLLESGNSNHPDNNLLIETLVKCQFLVSSHELELERIKKRIRGHFISKDKQEDLYLIIAVTTKCNFRCSYCYQLGSDNKVSMNDKVMDNLVDFASTFVAKNNTKRIQVLWYGGEPTLEIETIETLTKKFTNIIGKDNYKASIITNGYLLDKKTLERLKRCNIWNFSITIDGDRDTHNKRRFLSNGQATYDQVLGNLFNCSKDDKLHISVRINCDPSFGTQYVPVLEQLKKLGIHKKLHVSIAYTRYLNEEKRGNAYKSLEWIDFEKEHQHFCDNNDFRRQVRVKVNKPKYSRCMVCDPYNYVISPTGDIVSCLEEIGDDSNTKKPFANISMSYKNIMEKKSAETCYWEEGIIGTLLSDDKCMNCKYLPVCFGGCPREILNTTEFRKSDGRCHYYKFDMEYYVSKAYERSIESGWNDTLCDDS